MQLHRSNTHASHPQKHSSRPELALSLALIGIAGLPGFARASAQHAAAPALQESKLPAEPTPVVERKARFDHADLEAMLPQLSAQPRFDAPSSDVAHAAQRYAGSDDPAQVYYDEPGDGWLWAHGGSYKSGFGADGTVYAPFLGSDAPRSFPVTFRVERVSVDGTELAFDAGASAARLGNRVSYERALFDEVYTLAPGSIEQSFVFAGLPKRGELVVRISAETELEARDHEGGFEFRNDLGSVRYGRATAIDAFGATVSAPTVLTASGIEIRVPASFVAVASFPLTIDPVISTFSIDNTTKNTFLADVAHDHGTDRFLAVYEEVFSSSDHDIRWRLLNSAGASLATGFVESSLSQYWANPAVANNDLANLFLIVAEEHLPNSPLRAIRGRLFNPATLAPQGSVIAISGTVSSDMFNPDVGGTTASSWAVVWERTFASNDHDIQFRLVSQSGVPANSTFSGLDTSAGTMDTKPSISKSNDGGTWNIVWNRTSTTMPLQQDIRGARLLWNGIITAPSFSIDSGPAMTTRPSASTSLSGTDRWMVAFERDFNSDWDVMLIALDNNTVLDSVSLSGLEAVTGNPIFFLEDQLRPDIDSDGKAFAIAYSETTNGGSTDTNIYVATVAMTGNQINISEGHKILAGSFTGEGFPAIASKEGAGGGLRRYMAVWENAITTGTNSNIEGGLYDGGLFTTFCNPNGGGDAVCPCNNPASAFGRGCNNSQNTGGAIMSLFGLSSLSGDTLNLFASALKANSLAVFNQGTTVVAPSVTFGQGARCVGGTLKRLYQTTSLSGGTASVPQTGSPNVHTRSAAMGDTILAGTTRAYYVFYRDPVVLGGCPSASTFNTTQSMQAIWIP